MNFSMINVLAGLLIVLASIKLVVVFVSPRAWLRFVRRVYAAPTLTSTIALLLAALVLYLLLQSGLTIVQVLAVTVFVALLLVVGIAPYAGRLFERIETQSLPAMLRQQWLYIVVWVLLLGWGAVEILVA
ncbi:MAG TPA: hypothetical protein VD839_08610 [Burkholderiales bacterium]|nr:hypothetical protein [Burkholderiales bacterium]